MIRFTRTRRAAFVGALTTNLFLAGLNAAAEDLEVTGLAADYVVIDKWGFDDRPVYSDAPSLVRLPDGALLCAASKGSTAKASGFAEE